MGSTCEVAVIGGSSSRLADVALRRAQALEQRWSRFISSSEISRLNEDPTITRKVSADTFLLIDHAVTAWRWTSGRFDPTVLHAMIANGYDRSFEAVSGNSSRRPAHQPASGCSGITLDPTSLEVTLGRDVGFDPGGIGKGLAADLIVESLLDAGATGACVSMGGDIRVAGEFPSDGWVIGIANPLLDDDLITAITLQDHGLATSNRLMRRWTREDVELNHLVDPKTGRPVTGYVAASVITGQAWWSEALSKVAMVDSSATRLIFPHLVAEGLFVRADGSVDTTPGFSVFDVAAVQAMKASA